MAEIVVEGVAQPLYVLTMQDNEFRKCTVLTIGDRSAMVQKMREISEVMHVSGDLVVDDMSRALSGYPLINHQKVNMQVISWRDYVEASEGMNVSRFIATGEHLS